MIIENPPPRPPVMTFLSEPGMGKTTLACLFPDAIIIRTEDGIESVPEQWRPAVMPICTTVDMIEEQIRWIAANRKTHKRKTVIFDSVTRAETMFENHIVRNDPNMPSSINQACGGFGAGPKALGALHAKFRKLFQALNDRGMTVIIIAHASTETVEPPDGENYSRYTMRLGKHSIAPWSDDVDLIGFLCLQRHTTAKKDAKVQKAMSDGTRLLVCHATAGNISKNRYDIEDSIELPHPKTGKNPLLELIPYYRAAGLIDTPEQVKPKPKPEEASVEQSPLAGSDTIEDESEQSEEETVVTGGDDDYQEPEL